MIRIKLKKNYPLKLQKRLRNKARVRKKIFGTQEVPRLNVFRSAKHIYAQLIDDKSKKTLCAFSSLKIKEKASPKEKAKKVGEILAQKAKEQKIEQVVFDRGGFIYHGRIQSLAEGARSSGLKF